MRLGCAKAVFLLQRRAASKDRELLTTATCVYGSAGRRPPPMLWENTDGRRVEDGRYKRFSASIVEDGVRSGQVVTDSLRTFAYGTDASFYRLVPKVVVKVRNEDEVATVLKRARQYGTPVTFRAAGTSLSGQAITDSVLVQISQNGTAWKKCSIEERGDRVTVEPGVIGGEVNAQLAAYSRQNGTPPRKLGPDPASIDSCMIGGIFNNNSSGMCCGVAQNTYHTAVDVRVMLYDGTILDTADPTSVSSFEQTHASLLTSLSDAAASVQANPTLSSLINRKFSIKCTTGYSINALVDCPPSRPLEILKKLLVGSEGTLAFLSRVTYCTVADHPHRGSAFLMFPSVHGACSATAVLKKSGLVAAAELFDRAALREGERDESFRSLVRGLVGCPEAAAGLLVEVRGETEEELHKRIDKVWETLRRHSVHFLSADGLGTSLESPNTFEKSPKHFNVFWDMRKGIIPKVGAARKVGTVLLIEDVVCPIDNLADMTLDLITMFKRFKYKDACIIGHALDGNLHLLFSQGFATDKELRIFERLMADMARIVARKHGGSLKGEHGTGRNVASFVEMEWGEEAYALMRNIKKLFDPENLLNPGVLLSEDPLVHMKNLKVLPPAHELVDKCIECGFCESNCPSRDITLTPRQRITVVRELARMQGAGGREAERLKAFNISAKYFVEETCAADGMCRVKCPVGINTGKLVKDLRAVQQGRNKGVTALIARLIAGNFAAFAAANRLLLAGVALVRNLFTFPDYLIAGVTGALRASLGTRLSGLVPMHNKFIPGPSRGLPALPSGKGQEVVYVPSCVVRMMGPVPKAEGRGAAAALASILGKAGYTVRYPAGVHGMCCGMLFDSRGCRSAADYKAKELAGAVDSATRGGVLPVVCETSPCVKQQVEVGTPVHDPVQFIYLARRKLQWTKTKRTVRLHVPCSSKQLGTGDQFVALAHLCADEVVLSGVACCGMAGDRGLRYPQLPEGSLQHMNRAKEQIPSYSTSTTCEIGLSAATGIPWSSLLTLIDQSTSPLKAAGEDVKPLGFHYRSA